MFIRLFSASAAFARNQAANTTMIFGLAAPMLLGGVGASVDYARYVASRSSIQSIADGAALAGVQSLRISTTTSAAVSQIVSSYVAGQTPAGAPAIAATATVGTGNTVQVQLQQAIPTVTGRFVGMRTMNLAASAKARLSGGSLPNCMIALEAASPSALSFEEANLSAAGCQIYSNSAARDGLRAADRAKISAGAVCSHGGVKNDGTATINPIASTDCPTLADPLAARAQPTVGGCLFNNIKISFGMMALVPGVYCGGIQVTGGASVSLLPGVYIIKNGPFNIKANSSLSGTDVTIFLTGSNATVEVENKATVNLTAPATGAMAGMLIFEDRASPAGQKHKFESRNAPNMLGTIYLPQGYLEIGVSGSGGGAGNSIGASSAWTAIVARRVSVSDSQTLTLNTNYGATRVPPPAGIGPTLSSPQLIN